MTMYTYDDMWQAEEDAAEQERLDDTEGDQS